MKRSGRWTLATRGLDFRDAVAAFDGRPARHATSIRHDEARIATVVVIAGKHHTVVWMWRGTNRHIISFRRARDGEEAQYRACFGGGGSTASD
ncbi:MAG: BrnT family toxin [Rhodospirillales bacterium]